MSKNVIKSLNLDNKKSQPGWACCMLIKLPAHAIDRPRLSNASLKLMWQFASIILNSAFWWCGLQGSGTETRIVILNHFACTYSHFNVANSISFQVTISRIFFSSSATFWLLSTVLSPVLITIRPHLSPNYIPNSGSISVPKSGRSGIQRLKF